MEPPQDPAGPYAADPNPSPERRRQLIDELAAFPAAFRGQTRGLTDAGLDTPYRNWTVRQIVHHVADSHAHAYLRVKWTLTEETPTIKPYDESLWSALADAKTLDVGVSLAMLDAVHARWVAVLRNMSDADFARCYIHPQYKHTYSLAEALGQYAWHGRHHAAQVAWVRANRLRGPKA